MGDSVIPGGYHACEAAPSNPSGFPSTQVISAIASVALESATSLMLETLCTISRGERDRVAAHIVALIEMTQKRRSSIIALTDPDE